MPRQYKWLSFKPYLGKIIQRPVWALVAIGLITCALAWQLPHLSFKTAIDNMVIEELPQAGEYRDFRNVFGSDEMVRIVVRAKDVFDPFVYAKISELSEAVQKIEGVRRVLSLPEVRKNVDPQSQWTTDKFISVLEPVDLFQRNLISTDRQTTIITLILIREADKDAVVSATHRLIDSIPQQNIKLYQIGMPLVSEALAYYAKKDVLQLTPITMGVIAILLAVLFHNLHCIVLPLSCVSLATIWTFGYMAFRDIPVSMLTIIVPVFIIAVGTAYCLHICSAYISISTRETTSRAATKVTFSGLIFPVTLALLTTVFGIGSLATSRITAITEFAEFACFGIACLWVIIVVFFPATLALLPLPKRGPSDNISVIDRFFNKAIRQVIELNLHHQKACLTIIGVIAAICFIGLFFVRVETNPVAYFKPETEVRRNFHDIYQKMSGSFPVHVVMRGNIENYFEDPSNVAEIERLQTFLSSIEGVDKTVSFADYLKLVNYASNRFNPDYYALPANSYEMRILVNNFKNLLGADLLKGFMSSDMRQANILMLTHISSSREFIEARKAILDHVFVDLDRNLSVDVTGLGVVMAASSQLITMGQIKSLSLSLILIFAVMVALFLSAKVGLIAVIPNLFPILVNFGLMGLFGIPLSIATSLIASIAIGLAVDDTIHYLVRYNSEFKKDLDKDRAMRDTLSVVGRPIMFTSLTIGIGFSVLIFSHFQPTATFGLMMIITMVSALVGDLILLPTLMMHVELITAWDMLKIMPFTGSVTSNMVHEFSRTLNDIKIRNDLVKMIAKDEEKSSVAARIDYLTDEIGKEIEQASQTIERFQGLGELTGFEKELISINVPIEGTLNLSIQQMQLNNIDIETILAENLPPVKIQYNRLVHVVSKVMTNAREAILVRQQSGRSSDKHTICLRTFEEEESVVLAVEDSGCGFTFKNVDRAFEPFFTTKTTGKGKGLGLTICREIVRDCRGTITLSNRSPAGASVVIRFPAQALDKD